MESSTVVKGIELWQWRQQALQAARDHNLPVREVDWLLLSITSLSSLEIKLESFRHYPAISIDLSLDRLEQLWQRRILEHFPVQYIAGYTLWRRFRLQVSPAVLIPRPETEMLIDLAIAALSQPTGNLVDLGTGSGAIAIGLAEVFPEASIHAVELSPEALVIARANAENSGFSHQIQFYQGSWWEPLDHLRGRIQAVIANPPYIPTGMLPTLPPEVANHEPCLALDGGMDGLACLRYLGLTAPQYLQLGGLFLVEIMAGQGKQMSRILHEQGCYADIQIHADLAGYDRFAQATLVST